MVEIEIRWDGRDGNGDGDGDGDGHNYGDVHNECDGDFDGEGCLTVNVIMK